MKNIGHLEFCTVLDSLRDYATPSESSDIPMEAQKRISQKVEELLAELRNVLPRG